MQMMMDGLPATGLEHKFCRADAARSSADGTEISGYASVFGACDQGGDIVARGAYARSLAALARAGRRVQDAVAARPAQPIGVWDEVREDDRGLFVKGRMLTDVARGREAAALLAAGAIDGLSIGYRTIKAQKNATRAAASVRAGAVGGVAGDLSDAARRRGWRPRRMTPRQGRDAARPGRRCSTGRPPQDGGRLTPADPNPERGPMR
jgi:HK97 family phage prohead protease